MYRTYLRLQLYTDESERAKFNAANHSSATTASGKSRPWCGGKRRSATTLFGKGTSEARPRFLLGPGLEEIVKSGIHLRCPRAFASPFNPAADYHSRCMTAFPQSSPPGPEPFRSPEPIRRCVSGPRKRSSHPKIRRPETSAADVRPSSVRKWPEPIPSVVLFDSVRLNTSPISHSVCSTARTSICQCDCTMPLNTKYRAAPGLRQDILRLPMNVWGSFKSVFTMSQKFGMGAGAAAGASRIISGAED